MDVKTAELEIVANFKTAKVYLEEEKNILIVKVIRAYIPLDEFKEIFEKVNELISFHSINKLVFDKRKLKVFHQPSMEWHFVEWKEEAYNLGLKVIRKILPDDMVFKQCAKIGRAKIEGENPHAKFNEMDICYTDSIEEALKE